jgi:acyl-CoA thioesterase-2
MMRNGGLQTVLNVLDLTPSAHASFATGEQRFGGNSFPAPLGDRVYGGQVLAQALLACGRTVAENRAPHSLHAYFLRAGTIHKPIEFIVENLHDGGSFSARRVRAMQDGAAILSATASFQLDQGGYEAFPARPQGIPAPESVPTTHELLHGTDFPNANWWGRDAAFDLVPVSPSLFLQPDPHPSPEQMVWVKARGVVGRDAPILRHDVSEQLLHRALLAFACDQLLLEPAVRGAGKSWTQVFAERTAIASLDHAMWWHRDVRVDEWLLFIQTAASSQGGRSLGQASVYSREGELVATIAQEGLLRLRT